MHTRQPEKSALANRTRNLSGNNSTNNDFDVNEFIERALTNFTVNVAETEFGAPGPESRWSSGQATPVNRSQTPIERYERSPTPLGLPPTPAPRNRSHSSENLPESQIACVYCGAVDQPMVGIYCRDCVTLFANSSEVKRRLHEFQKPRQQALTPEAETSSLLPAVVPTPSIYIPPRPEIDYREEDFEEEDSSVSNYRSSYTASLGEVRKQQAAKRLSLCPSLTSQSSVTRPLCRICQLPGEPNDALISPCRCSGTMQHVHKSCLVHWLEISTRKMCPSPRCELCGYQYRTYHCLKVQKVHMPECIHKDKALHSVFIVMTIVMVGCAALSIVYLQRDNEGARSRNSLNSEDITVITCSVLFFLAFFVAVFTQYRADATLCTLFFRCWLINKHWRIRNYDSSEDKAQWITEERI